MNNNSATISKSLTMEVGQYSYIHPTSFIISGATQSGKSTFVKNLLINKEKLIQPTPKVTYLFYKIWQPIFTEMKEMGLVTTFTEGMPDMDELFTLLQRHESTGGSIVIFDDMGTEIKKHHDKFIELFSVYSHHIKLVYKHNSDMYNHNNSKNIFSKKSFFQRDCHITCSIFL